ncbi:retrotransposon expressed [Lasius niger]|uniref:Retrotransposon expressed n=1 Tax=Lasius niger TaxID=67767 RepID=A0A0J7N8N1_LASNI|nr:retrotransposon expressed [Lasius niger]
MDRRPPRLDHMRIFGSTVYVLDKNTNKDKFDARSNKGIFIGYPEESKGYRVWFPDSRKIIIARDVKFLEKTPEAPENLDEIDFLEKSKQVRVMESTDEGTPNVDGSNSRLPCLCPHAVTKIWRFRGR